MQNTSRAIVIGILSLIVGISTLLVPSVSYAHPLPLRPNSHPFFTTYVMNHGLKQTLKAAFGQEIVIPAKNGYSIHIKTDFIPAKNDSTIRSLALTPNNGSIPIYECGYATGQVVYKDPLDITVMQYSLSDEFCNNGVAVTSQLQPSGGGGGLLGVSLVGNSTSKGWVQRPAIAYARGDYTFNVGIVTPWVTIGNNCVGSIQINLYDDGPFNDYYTYC